nr:putative ribonuclease H-like domain-containing protein [Tanacetum cinerariifolium]
MMKGSDIRIQENKAKLFNEWELFTSTDGESIESYYHRFLKLMNDLKRNKHFPEKIARLDRQMQIVGGNGGNQFRQYAGKNVGNLNRYNAVQNVRNQNPNGNGNLVAARAEGNATGHNEFSDDSTPSVAQKFINEVKRTIVTLQHVVKHRMTLDTHNWSSSAHQELYKIVKNEIFSIVNQVNARVQNFEIQFLKEAAKFVRDFKSLAKEADESFAKHKALELEIERLLRVVVSQDIMSVENEYAKLWNDWYKKCEECKFDKFSYDKAYNDMKQKIDRLQAQLGDLKGVDNTKTKRPQSRSNTKNDRVPSASKSSCMNNYYTWLQFLRSKDEAPEVIKTFLKQITVLLQSPVIIIRTDNDTEFKNQVLKEYFDSVGISHQVSSVRTPQQNGVVEQRNRILVKAARTMLFFFRAPLFLWAEAIATVVYNRRTKKIMETMNVTFDELSTMAFEQSSSKPGLQSMTSGQISSGLDLTYAPSTITTQQPTEVELDLLFEAMYNDYIGDQPSTSPRTVSAAQALQVRQTPTTSTSIEDTAPTPTNSSSQATNFPITTQDVDRLKIQQQHGQQQGNQAPLQPKIVSNNVPNAMFDENMFIIPFATPSTSAAESSSSQYVDLSNMHTLYQPYPYEFQWSKDHPLEHVIGEPS